MKIKKTDPNKQFATLLKGIMKRSVSDKDYQITDESGNKIKLTGAVLAKLIGKSPRTISSYVRGEIIPSEKEQERILSILSSELKIDIDTLAPGLNPENFAQIMKNASPDIPKREGSGSKDEEKNVSSDQPAKETELEKKKRIYRVVCLFRGFDAESRHRILENYPYWSKIGKNDFALMFMYRILNSSDKDTIKRMLSNLSIEQDLLQANQSYSINMFSFYMMSILCKPVSSQECTPKPPKKGISDSEDVNRFQRLVSTSSAWFTEAFFTTVLSFGADDWFFLASYYRLLIFEDKHPCNGKSLPVMISNAIEAFLSENYTSRLNDINEKLNDQEP